MRPSQRFSSGRRKSVSGTARTLRGGTRIFNADRLSLETTRDRIGRMYGLIINNVSPQSRSRSIWIAGYPSTNLPSLAMSEMIGGEPYLNELSAKKALRPGLV